MPCSHMEVHTHSYFWWCGCFWGPWVSFVTTDEFSARVIIFIIIIIFWKKQFVKNGSFTNFGSWDQETDEFMNHEPLILTLTINKNCKSYMQTNLFLVALRKGYVWEERWGEVVNFMFWQILFSISWWVWFLCKGLT